MGDSVDAAALAELRARAYGPAATGLTAAEQTRLDELELAARPPRPRTNPHAPPTAEPKSPAVAHDPAAAPEVIRLRPSRGYLVALVAVATLVPVAAIGGFLVGA